MSEDSTLQEIEALARKDERIQCIILDKGLEKETAVMAGLDYASGDYIIVMKGDLQHPPNMICHIINKLDNGIDIVNTTITNMAKVNLLQRWSLNAYYKIIDKLSNSEAITDITQFRGFRKEVVHDLLFIQNKKYLPENYFSWSNYKIISIKYKNRKASRKNILYTRENLTLTTNTFIHNCVPMFTKPMVFVGATLSIASLLFISLLIIELCKGNAVNMNALSLTSILFAGGLQIFVYGSYRKKIKSELLRIGNSHHYVMNHTIEPEDFMSKYSYSGYSEQE
jgi:glucosyltransferase